MLAQREEEWYRIQEEEEAAADLELAAKLDSRLEEEDIRVSGTPALVWSCVLTCQADKWGLASAARAQPELACRDGVWKSNNYVTACKPELSSQRKIFSASTDTAVSKAHALARSSTQICSGRSLQLLLVQSGLSRDTRTQAVYQVQPTVSISRVCLFLLQSGLDRDTWIDDDDGNEWQMPTSLLQDPVAETVGQTAEEAAAKLLQVSPPSHRHPHTLCCHPTPACQPLPLPCQTGGCLHCACWGVI